MLEARSDTTATGRIAGARPHSQNKMARQYIRREKEGADRLELEKYTLGSLRRAAVYGDAKNGSLMAGQVAGMCTRVRPVAEIIQSLFSNSGDVLERLEGEFNRTAEK